MNLYEFTLPITDNAGRPTKLALAEWETRALRIAGGYTVIADTVRGAWADPNTEKVYVDHVRVYRVGCGQPEFSALLAAAFRLFPDQAAIFSAQVGTATVHMRSVAAA